MHVTAIALLGVCMGIAQANPITDAGLFRRQDTVKSCDDESVDYTGPYKDGEGTYATSDGVSHPYKFPRVRKCWWDYFVVTAEPQMLPWQRASGNKYCTGTDTCTVAQMTGASVCQGRSTTISAEVGFSIEGFTLGAGVQTTESEDKCVQATDTTSCVWNDQGCHVIWTQQEVLKQTGYRRHRCNWGNGDETECMGDWEMTTPTDRTDYGCGSSCDDTNLGGKDIEK
ncbi:hypothetical protein ACO1O0_006727 [Amphichorda felina]